MNDTLKRCLVTGLFFLSAAAYAQTPVCEWTMAGGNGTIPNGGSTGSAGNLSLTSGARLSDDVLPQNTGGNALQILGGYPTASAESAAAFDPLAGAGAFTIMGWVRRESASAGVNQSARLWSDIDTRSSRADGVEFRLSGAAGLLSLRINGQEVQSSTAGVAPDNGAWHHVAVVYDGSRAATNYNSRHVHFYIDGIQMGYGNVLSGLVVSGNTVPVTIGNSSADRSADNALVGSIDDVFVFRGWAPPPSGNGNPNPEIQSWLLLDDSTRIPGGESSDRVVPPVLLSEVQVQKIGNERFYENLKEGVIFLDGASGELYVATQDAPHGRAVCSCREWPDWHNFTNTLHINGNRIELNRFFSMQAEGNSLSIRTGTNSVFQIVGSDIGDYAPVYATPESQESYLLTANVQAEQAVLQVCTNLLEANGWRTDTVSEIIETTDASVTWRVPISAGTEPEFRRVLSATQMPAGIYARQQLVAEQGIEMGGERWDAWPDMGAYASTGSVATVASNLVTHAGNTSNPHGVTLLQAFDEDPDGAWEDFGLGVSPGDGISELRGFGHRISFEEAFAEGDFNFWNRPTFGENGLATTNEVAAVESRVDDLESWRDMPETCCLYWPVDFVVANSVITTNYTTVTNDGVVVTNATVLHTLDINQFVTNCPTRRLELTIRDKGIEKLNIKFNPAWTPDSPKEININVISSSGNPTNRATRVMLNNTEAQYVLIYTAYNQYQDVTLSYDPGSSHYWRTVARARLYASYWWNSDNGARATAPTLQPATVEEWMAARPRSRSLDRAAKLALDGPPQEVPLGPAKPGDLGIDGDLTVREGMEATIELTGEE